MRFSLFMYCTVGRRAELEAGMAGRNPALYQRMLDEIAEYVRFADDAGYFGFGHPEHHLQIEGFEISNDPRLMSMWLGRHSKKLRVITCGFVSTTHNPLRVAEDIATMDHMLGGRFGVGLVRGYQARWVENFKVRDELNAVGPWNKDQPADVANREYFSEFVDVVVKALSNETFSHHGKYWTFPPAGMVNPHDHPVYVKYGQGVTPAMKIEQVGIAPRPHRGGGQARPRREERPAGGLGRHLRLRTDRRRGPGMGQGHDVVLAELGDAVRPGHAGAPGRLARHDLAAARAGASGDPRSGRGDPAHPARHPRPPPDPDVARIDGHQGDAEIRLEHGHHW